MYITNNPEKITNVAECITLLLKRAGIETKPKEVVIELDLHPDPLSLLAISDVLRNYGVNSGAYEVSAEEFSDIQDPAIICLNTSHGEFAFCHAYQDQGIIVSNERWNKHFLSWEQFREVFMGYVLYADEQATVKMHVTQSNPSVFNQFKNHLFISLFILTLLSLGGGLSTVASGVSAGIVALVIIKALGVAVSVVLIMAMIDAKNPLVSKFCGENSIGCNSILQSKAAYLTPKMSWAEIGLFYFTGSFLAIVFSNNLNVTIQVLRLLNLAALPFTFYSVIYQGFFAKQWCKLCLTVQLILWLEFTAGFNANLKWMLLPGAYDWYRTTAFFAVTVLAWMIFRNSFTKLSTHSVLQRQLNGFKFNAESFNKMLADSAKHPLLPEQYSIILGNPEAETILTIVSNPYCRPCAHTHQIIDNWDMLNRIKLQIVFSTFSGFRGDDVLVARHLLALNKTNDKSVVEQAIKSWYHSTNKNFDHWSSSFPSSCKNDQDEVLAVQKEWCLQQSLFETPSVLINGHKLPSLYKIQEIKYLI